MIEEYIKYYLPNVFKKLKELKVDFIMFGT
jgi:hypothetical protein